MLSGTAGPGKQNSLMAEYSSLLAESVLRHKAWFAEHTARIETQLASKVKSEFIANMSHELRTPLNTVIGFAKLLGEHQKRPLKDGRDRRIRRSHPRRRHASARRHQRHPRHLQDAERQVHARCPRGRARRDPAGVAGLLQAGRARGARSRWRADIDPDLPTVKGDPAKLRQVFGNLIGNAIRFTPPGGTVSVEARATEDGGAAVCVRDTGLGMSSEEIAVASRPFAQVDASRSRWREGTGLGLPIAKALVQLHGGRLEIRSAKSLGTEVTVTLPSRFDGVGRA